VTDTPDALRAALADRYAIERELGAGGMATVYLAEDRKHHRKVALKVMRPELAATMGATRFLREIETAAQLQHPHILPLHDSGEAGGFLYFVMPYVEGEPLRTRLARRGELPVGEAIRVLRDVADALAYAHAHGVVHRDIKPDNVMLSGRHALVTDFGVAKAVSDATGRQSITTVGVALGTPSYMSPEQAAADPQVDHRADIYALGCLAYELLSGHPPFHGDSAQQVLAAHLTQAPAPVTSDRPAVPAPLNALVMHCLEKKPADRWQTADEVLTQLEGLMTPSGGITPTDTRPLTGARAAVAPRWRLVAAAGAGVAVLALGAWALFGRGGGSGSGGKPRLVVLPPRNLGPPEQAYVADGIAEEINNRLVGLSGLEVIGRTSAERYRDTDKSPRQIADELGVAYLLALRVGSEGPASGRRLRVSAELLRGATEAQLWGQSFIADSADDYFRVQGEIATAVASAMGVTLGAGERDRIAARPTSNAEAYDYYLRGAAAVSRGYGIADFRDGVERFTRAVELDPRFARAWAGLATAHIELYWFHGDRSTRRIELAQQALERAAALAPDDPEVVLIRGIFRYHAFLDYEGALRELEQLRQIDPGRAEAYEWMAYVQRRSGRVAEAVTSLERALELDPQSGRLLGGLAETYLGVGRYGDAQRLAERALDMKPNDWGPHSVRINTAVAAGDLAGAAARVREAIARITWEVLLVDRPDLLRTWLPLLAVAEQRAVGPLPALTAAMADTAGYYLARAQLRELQGQAARADFDTAAAWYERRRAARPDDPWIGIAAAMAYAGQGRRDDALRAAAAAVTLAANDTWEGPGTHEVHAGILWRFGERDSAAAELERYIAAGPQARDLARHDPRYTALREHPRIRQLLRS
jgi:serine/threonine-protein kinase